MNLSLEQRRAVEKATQAHIADLFDTDWGEPFKDLDQGLAEAVPENLAGAAYDFAMDYARRLAASLRAGKVRP